jgi:glycosyltransferase involved in cell wall biosynthesis
MQDPSPLVTVGIPTYNRPRGLERTLQCILSQTYRNIRVIVSDNCSTDKDVLPLLQRYAARDERLHFVIQETNRSIVPNFQYLLDQAEGDYFMWAADDDYWDANFIETCVGAMQSRPDVILCMPDLKLTFEDGSVRDSRLNRSFLQEGLLSRSFGFIKSTAENKYFFCGLYRTSLVKNIPFDNSWGGDHLFIYEALTKGKFLYVPGKSNFYYYRGGSSRGMDSVRKAFAIKSRFYFFDAYILRYTTYQFRFRHLGLGQKLGLFLSNWAGLVLNEDFILYYIFIKKPVKALFRQRKKENN